MSTRITWAIHAARRLAAERGLDAYDGEPFARSLAPRIADIARAIIAMEPRRGPREIALYQLRQITGRHAAAIPDLVMSADIDDAAATLLAWSHGELLLAADNPSPQRTLPKCMTLTVFHQDGKLTRWERYVEREDGDPARHGGRQ